MSLSFSRETVSRPTPGRSLLSSSLRASDGTHGDSEHTEGPPTADIVAPTTPEDASKHPRAASPPGGEGTRTPNGFRVGVVIESIVNATRSNKVLKDTDFVLDKSPDDYTLRVSEDDGTVDVDFPEVDASVIVTSVGVNKFVLCDRSSERPMVRVVIPETRMQLHAYEVSRAPEDPSLLLTCHVIGPDGRSSKGQFRVRLTLADTASAASSPPGAESAVSPKRRDSQPIHVSMTNFAPPEGILADP